MTVVNPKSISGINSITTGSGSDNLLTIHTSDASSTERVRINSSGDVIVGSGITVSPDGDIFATGVTTSTTFVGALTGTASANAVLTGSTNNTVTTVTGANAIQGESALTFDGNTLTISAPSNDTPFLVDTASTNGAHLRFQKDGSNQHFVGAGGGFSLGDREDLSLRAYDNILFASGNSSTERVRIDDYGVLRVGNTHDQATSSNTKRIALGAKGSIWGWASGQVDGAVQLADNYYWTGTNNVAIESDYCAYLSLRSGSLRFGTTASSQTGGSNVSGGINEKVRFQQGGGISFNGDTAAANALDDYEEGDWTPTVSQGASSVTYSEQYGRYVKVGKMVTLSLRMRWSGTAADAGLRVSGLPFTSASGNGNNYTSGGITYWNVAVNYKEFDPYIGQAHNFISFYRVGTGDLIKMSGNTSNAFIGLSAVFFVD